MSNEERTSKRDGKLDTRFLYPRLDLNERQIRVIQVLPGGPKDVIECRMKVVPLGENHIALSYVWGEDAASHVININGAKFFVRSNLMAFLEHARRNLAGRWLWIDAICINQNGISERNHQVRQMVDIYASASYVLIWFGKYYKSSRRLLSKIRLLDENQSPWEYFLQKRKRWKKLRVELLELFSAKYWSRLWIVPEVLKAKRLKLACSTGAIDWNPFMAFVHTILGTEKQPSIFDALFKAELTKSKLVVFQDMWLKRDHKNYSLGTLLRMYGQNECSDLRDKVFVLINLSKDSKDLLIDYNMSRTQLLHYVISNTKMTGPGKLELISGMAKAMYSESSEYSQFDSVKLLKFFTGLGRPKEISMCGPIARVHDPANGMIFLRAGLDLAKHEAAEPNCSIVNERRSSIGNSLDGFDIQSKIDESQCNVRRVDLILQYWMDRGFLTSRLSVSAGVLELSLNELYKIGSGSSCQCPRMDGVSSLADEDYTWRWRWLFSLVASESLLNFWHSSREICEVEKYPIRSPSLYLWAEGTGYVCELLRAFRGFRNGHAWLCYVMRSLSSSSDIVYGTCMGFRTRIRTESMLKFAFFNTIPSSKIFKFQYMACHRKSPSSPDWSERRNFYLLVFPDVYAVNLIVVKGIPQLSPIVKARSLKSLPPASTRRINLIHVLSIWLVFSCKPLFICIATNIS